MKKKGNIITLFGLMTMLFVSTASINGQSAQTWYNNAQQRIDTLRRGTFGIHVLDKNDQPYSTDVSVRLVKHEFPFGIAFDFYEGEIETTFPTETQWMKAAMYEYFNYGVSGNSFKWSGIQPQHTAPNYTNFEHAVKWTQKVGWELRAHTLLWSGNAYEDHHQMPKWVKDLPTPQAITDTCKTRVIREVSRYKGIVKEYDVINEPLNSTYLGSVVGDSIYWNCFKWAFSADSTAKLFVNEYNVEYSWGKAEEYRDLILKIKENGGQISGVGIQAHFWECCRPNINDLLSSVNTIAEAGLPIKFTEYDYAGTLSQEEQAADFIKVLTFAFSHPSLNGMICWGLSDKAAWREGSGFFESNHKPKKAADTLLYYTKKLWTTKFDSVILGDDPLYFDAYYGKYEIKVNYHDTVKVFYLPCNQINKDSVFVLRENEAEIKGPEIVNRVLAAKNKIKLTYDKAIDEGTINVYNFRLFSQYSSTITSINIDPEDENSLLLNLSKNTLPGEFLYISYFPGTLLSTDGGIAQPLGLKPISNPIINDVDKFLNELSINIYPVPASTTLNIEGIPVNSTISVFNSSGVNVYTDTHQTNDTKQISLEHMGKGIYFVQVSNDRYVTFTSKVVVN